MPHDQYVVKVDGSGRMTTRNRKFLRGFQPASATIHPAPPPSPIGIEQGTPDIMPVNVGQHAEPIDEPIDHQMTQNNSPLVPNQDTVIEDSSYRSENIASKVSRAAKRLLPFNEEGLKEMTDTPNSQGRKLRNRIVNNHL